MRADPREARQLSALVRIIWQEHSLEELTKIIISYMSSENPAEFSEILNGEYAGVALCALRHICFCGINRHYFKLDQE